MTLRPIWTHCRSSLISRAKGSTYKAKTRGDRQQPSLEPLNPVRQVYSYLNPCSKIMISTINSPNCILLRPNHFSNLYRIPN